MKVAQALKNWHENEEMAVLAIKKIREHGRVGPLTAEFIKKCSNMDTKTIERLIKKAKGEIKCQHE